MSSWNFPERIEPPDDDRPVIGICPVCGQDFHGENSTDYGDDGFELDGYFIHEDCILEYLSKYKVR